jgi:hypothetical protein
MNPGAIAIRNDGKYAAPVNAKEGIYVIAQNNTIESLSANQGVYFQKLWLYPYKSVSGGVLTANAGNVSLGKSGNAAAQNLTSLVGVGTLVTATLDNHGYEEGMSVTIAGSSDSAYNGTFPIKNVDRNTFQYVAASAVTNGKITASITAQRTRYLPDVLQPSDTLGMSYILPDGMKLRLSDVIIYGTATDGVFYSYV